MRRPRGGGRGRRWSGGLREEDKARVHRKAQRSAPEFRDGARGRRLGAAALGLYPGRRSGSGEEESGTLREEVEDATGPIAQGRRFGPPKSGPRAGLVKATMPGRRRAPPHLTRDLQGGGCKSEGNIKLYKPPREPHH